MVDLEEVFSVRALVMRTVPKLLRGAYRGAVKMSLEQICKGRATNNLEVETRGWKLFLLIPRLLLWRPPRGGLVPRARLEERSIEFRAGEWVSLLERSLEAATQGSAAQSRRRRRQKDSLERRVERAMGLAQLGELSNARQALEGEAIALGNDITRKMLTDKLKRPPSIREPIDRDILGRLPRVPLDLDVDKLLKNLRESRKGSAGGPSGMTCEHLKPLLESAACCRLLGEAATQFARGQVPHEIAIALKMGRMKALQKPDGGVRGIVVGDVMRRLVARTLAQHFKGFEGLISDAKNGP